MERTDSDGRNGAPNMKYYHTNPPDHLSDELRTIWNQGISWGDSQDRDRQVQDSDTEQLRKYMDLFFDSPPFAQMCKGSSSLTVKARNASNKDPSQRWSCSFCRATTGCFKIQQRHHECENSICNSMCKNMDNRNVFPLVRLNCEHALGCPIAPGGKYRNSLIQGIDTEMNPNLNPNLGMEHHVHQAVVSHAGPETTVATTITVGGQLDHSQGVLKKRPY